QPQPLQLLLLAQVTGLPLADLAAAADVPLERVRRQRSVVFDYVCWEVERSAIVPDGERPALLSRLHHVRSISTGPTEGDSARGGGVHGASNDSDDGAAAEDQKAEAQGARRRS